LDRIVVEGETIKLVGKATDYASLLANGKIVNQEKAVLATGYGWLSFLDDFRTLCYSTAG